MLDTTRIITTATGAQAMGVSSKGHWRASYTQPTLIRAAAPSSCPMTARRSSMSRLSRNTCRLARLDKSSSPRRPWSLSRWTSVGRPSFPVPALNTQRTRLTRLSLRPRLAPPLFTHRHLGAAPRYSFSWLPTCSPRTRQPFFVMPRPWARQPTQCGPWQTRVSIGAPASWKLPMPTPPCQNPRLHLAL